MLDGLGIARILSVDERTDGMWRAIRDALEARSADETTVASSGVWTTGIWTEPDESPAVSADGLVIAVWGPRGAPGRTTIATALSEALAVRGRRVCLVDADTYAPSIGLALGMLDEFGGLVRACRQAENGMLDVASVVSATRRISGSWNVLTGVPRADRWPELTPPALDRVWQSLRAAFDVTVVDIGFCVEDDDSPAAWARRRNAAAVSALATADHALAVACSTPAGAARLVAAWPEFSATAVTAPVTVVRNRVGRREAPGWTDALLEFGVGARVHAVPSDTKSVDACWSRGRSLGEGARRSPMRRSINGLARDLMSG
jgi:MinD-like ATPase involved in chromosome partitioning or flagellar assembly